MNQILLNFSVILANKSVCVFFKECPESTYKDFVGYANECTACPANSGHVLKGSSDISDCKCETGYKGSPENGQECTSKLRHDKLRVAKVSLKKCRGYQNWSTPLCSIISVRRSLLLSTSDGLEPLVWLRNNSCYSPSHLFGCLCAT